MRQQISLAGTWQFQLDPDGALRVNQLAPDREIPVPVPWQVPFPELESYIGHVWYQTTLDLADGLTREGVKPKDSGDLIAAAALDVTPAYVHELKSDAMVLTDVGDAIACKALDVDGPYVRGLAAAGYRNLTADDVVAMKAMDVSPDYARAMNRARGSGQ